MQLASGNLLVNGIVMELVAHDAIGDRSYLYEIAVAPQMRLLDLTKQNQIYGNRRSHIRKEIVKNSLEGKLGANHGNPSIPYEEKLGQGRQRGHPKPIGISSFNTTRSDLDFLSRWCERYGNILLLRIFRYRREAVFGDSNTAFRLRRRSCPTATGTPREAAHPKRVTRFGFVARPSLEVC